MSEPKLTWSEFAEKYKPKYGDRFKDDRENEWQYRDGIFWQICICVCSTSRFAKITTCPLIPPKATRKMWRAFTKRASGIPCVTEELFEDAASAKMYIGLFFHSWPAIPNADGSFTVPE